MVTKPEPNSRQAVLNEVLIAVAAAMVRRSPLHVDAEVARIAARHPKAPVTFDELKEFMIRTAGFTA
jgi:hypothetical protein